MSIILGRPFLRTIGAIIDMKEGNIRFQFPLKKFLSMVDASLKNYLPKMAIPRSILAFMPS